MVKGKQRLTYVTSLCKRLTEQRLGDIAKRKHLLRYKGQEIAGRDDRPYPEGIGKKKKRAKIIMIDGKPV